MPSVYYPGFKVCRIDANGARIDVTSATITRYNVTAASAFSSTTSDTDGNVAAGSVTATVGDVIRFGHGTYPEYMYYTLTATQAEAYTHPDNIEVAYVAENLAANNIDSEMVELYAQDLNNLDVTPWKIGEGYSGTTVEIPYQTNVEKNLRIFPRTIDKGLSRVRSSFQITTDAEDITVPTTSTDTFGDVALAAWQSVRSNSTDTALEAYDTRAARPLFDLFQTRTTTSTTEQTLHLFQVTRGEILINNGDRIRGYYCGTSAANADEKEWHVKFNGTDIGTVSQIANVGQWTVSFEIVRKNATTVRASCRYMFDTTSDIDTSYTEITGLDLDNTGYDLTFTAATPDATGDVTVTHGAAEILNAPAAAIVTTSMWDYWEADSYSQSDGTNITTNWVGKYASKVMTVSGTPTYEDSELNGVLPVIRLGADSNDYFTLPTMAVNFATAAHIFVVQKVTNTTTGGAHKFGSGTASTLPDSSDGLIDDGFCSTVRKDDITPPTALTAWHVYEVYSKSADWGLYINGMLAHSTITNTTYFHATPTIGFNGSAQYMKADLWGVYIFNGVLSDANREKMYRYIASVTGV